MAGSPGLVGAAELIVASRYQPTSHDGDMQLHTHNQIAHVAITRHDGKGRAPDSTALLAVVC
jgi:hypothetical protein